MVNLCLLCRLIAIMKFDEVETMLLLRHFDSPEPNVKCDVNDNS